MAAAASQATATTTAAPMTRREFLYYIWAASMALLLAEGTGAILWFAVPRFKAGEFGGIFEILLDQLPPTDGDPVSNDEGRFWLVNVGPGQIEQQYTGYPETKDDYPQKPGFKALYKICVHLGCLYKWVPTNHRFECPCHGSKYLPTGVRVDGPARRNLDVFVVDAINDQGQVIVPASPDGSALDLDAARAGGATKLRINTGKRIVGDVNFKPGGGK